MNENDHPFAGRAAPKQYVPPGTRVGVHFNSTTGQYETLYAHRPPVSPLRTVAIVLGILIAVTVVLLLVLTGGSDKPAALPAAPTTIVSSTQADDHPTDLTGLNRKIYAIQPAIAQAFATSGTATQIISKVCQALPILGTETTRASFVEGFNQGSEYAFTIADVSAYADAVIQYCQDTR